ncbi:MAG: OmpA family protein [Proteobacteria bacterium]|uniref:OmpA family protein n=1 Tax=Candidatus Enterousia excrementavium TaxID=2840789 RepID=A0A940DED3_9PROT|nr:OmpA family protein [Candidatus Enterousia excrementavium]
MLNIRFREKTNTWPAFVDLFSNLVIILIFLLIVFVFLWTTTNVFNRDTGAKTVADLKKTNAEQAERIVQMTADEEEAKRLLVLARTELENLSANNDALSEELAQVDMNMDELIADYESRVAELQAQGTDLQAQVANLTAQLNQATLDKQRTAELEQERRALQEQMATQRADLAQQLTQLQAALDAAEEASHQKDIQYVEMSNRLNKALADKVAELNDVAQYQSVFYKAIKDALGDDAFIETQGDRFIISSDILFSSGSYTLSPEGKNQLRLIANVIKNLEAKIPTNIDWIIRVDGHTDRKQVIAGTRGYSNNMELSLLRANAVVNELVADGVSRRRLVPSGFGDLHPVVLGTDAQSLQQNRRIELQLTNR